MTKTFYNRAEIAGQGSYLLEVSEVCRAHPNYEECEAAWPEVWARMGPLVWRGHFSHMCEDREAECGPSPLNYYGNLTVSAPNINIKTLNSRRN